MSTNFLPVFQVPYFDDIGVNDIHAIFKEYSSEFLTRPQVTPVSYVKSWLFELARVNEAFELTTSPDSENLNG